MRRIEEQGALQLRQVVLRRDDSVRRRREALARKNAALEALLTQVDALRSVVR